MEVAVIYRGISFSNLDSEVLFELDCVFRYDLVVIDTNLVANRLPISVELYGDMNVGGNLYSIETAYNTSHNDNSERASEVAAKAFTEWISDSMDDGSSGEVYTEDDVVLLVKRFDNALQNKTPSTIEPRR